MDQFEALADEVSDKAGKIRCDPEFYCAGLDVIIERLQSDQEAARET